MSSRARHRTAHHEPSFQRLENRVLSGKLPRFCDTEQDNTLHIGGLTMFRKFGCGLVGLLLAFQLSGCTALTGETLGQNVDDTTVTTSVKSKLALEKASSLTRVGVDTVKGVVHLTGVVENAGVRDRAEDVARSVGGVRGVVNNLQIQSK